MKCKFCGAEIKDGSDFCEACNKNRRSAESVNKTEETNAAKIIDSMPELHNELDRIGEMRERAKRRKKRVVFSMLIILVCAVGAWFGMNFFKDFEKTILPTDGEANKESVTSAVSGDVNDVFLGSNFTSVKVFDGTTAEAAIYSVKAELGITNADVGFVMKNKITVGNDTYYRFDQTFGGIKVYGGEVILAVSQNGTPIALNSRIIDTDGLNLNATLETGGASNAVSEYVNRLSENLRVTSGINVTAAEKTVCNFEGKTYLAYCSNVSGYNEKGEYVAYDAFVDASSGNGIFICGTSSYENEEAVSEDDFPAAENSAPSALSESEQNAEDAISNASTSEAAISMFVVNDKFNWNDKTKIGALDEISKEDIKSGNVSSYVSGTKSAVEKVYDYFADSFGYKGLDGKNGAFKVYLNSNEYLEDKLPPDSALYSDDVLMFIREDLTTGELDLNVATHEYAHGVIYNIAHFDGTGSLSENAAIAEGLADVFGELCEAYYAGGTADWVHGSRNLASPESGFLTELSEKAEIKDIDECYRYATIVSHAAYRMAANGVDNDRLCELMFRSLCLMTKGTDFSGWRSVTEFTAKRMSDEGRMTDEQFSAVIAALDNTKVKGQHLYATQVEEIGKEEAAEQIPDKTEASEKISEKVIE